MSNENKESVQDENGYFTDGVRDGITAVILILIGIGLLASNFLDIPFDNWWALFLLLPVIVMIYQVWRDYKSNGRLTSRSSGLLIGSLVLTSMLVTFLFDVNWGQLWPLFIIFGGIAVLLGQRLRK